MKIEKKYLYLGFSLVFMIIINQIIIQYFLLEKRKDAKTINISGRQRMLSQRVNLIAYRIYENPKSYTRAELLHIINDWEISHLSLLNGNEEKGISSIKDKNTIEKAKKALSKIHKIKSIITNSELIDKKVLNEINKIGDLFLEDMELIVGELEIETTNSLFNIILVEIILALISLGIIFFEFKKIIIPISQDLLKNQNLLETQNNDLLESQNNLNAILESTQDINILINKNFKILSFNKKANFEVLQNFKKSYHIGEDIREYFQDEDLKILNQYLPKVLKGEKIEIEFKRNINGETKYFDVTNLPIYDQNGEIFACNINLKDITDKKVFIDKIINKNEVLQEIAWQQSHEVRRPISNILGLADMLKNHKDNLSEESKIEFMDLLIESVKELDEIVHSIVDKTSVIND